MSQRIASYLRGKGSPLAPYANDFVSIGNKYGIDPRFLVAISGAETGFAKAGSRLRNPFGWNSATKYAGPRDVLERIGRGLSSSTGYYAGKNTIGAIGATWAPPGAQNDAGGNSGWPRAVGQFYRELGGNPNAQVKGLRRGIVAPAGGGTGPVATPVSPGLATVAGSTPYGGQMLQRLRESGDPLPASVVAGIKAYSDQARASVLAGTFNKNDSAFGAIRDAMIRNIKMRAATVQGQLGTGQIVPGATGAGPLGGVAAGAGAPVSGMTNYGSTRGVVRPLPTKPGGSSYGYSDPEGQGGRHLAHDWFAPANTAVASPVNGTIFRVKPDPNPGKRASGQVFGGSVYIRGDDGKVWVFRHVAVPERSVGVGQRVRAGQKIGGVKDWGGGSHAHIELYRPGPYEYSPARALNPWDFFRKAGIG